MATRTKIKGNFNWRILTIVPSLIEGPDAEASLDEFNGRADADYKENRNVKVLTYDDGIVKGSNSFAVVLMNQILRPQGIRTVTPADLGMILEASSLPLRVQYEDAALVLRGDIDSYDPNNSLAQDLARQVKDRGLTASPKAPVMIPLTGLDLQNADNQYGLAFKLRDDAELIEAPELVDENDGKTFSKTDDRGMPIFDGDVGRILYTRNEGLSRLYLDRGLYSGRYRLDDSYCYGRIVLVSGESGAPNFSA
ncbi:MAG: hypothetical protein IIA87_00880 [Nanoarchaeota archaeon]|nr:hypothetical protein [Nanoarchaeota archaeon]